MESIEKKKHLFQNVRITYCIAAFNKIFRSVKRETVIKTIPVNSELGGGGMYDHRQKHVKKALNNKHAKQSTGFITTKANSRVG